MTQLQGYKIDITEYKYETREEIIGSDGKFIIDSETNEPKLELKTLRVDPKLYLPKMLCNPHLSMTPGKADEDFDLYEIGAIAARIELATGHVTLTATEYGILKARCKVLRKYLNHKFYEMIRRIVDAETVELKEA